MNAKKLRGFHGRLMALATACALVVGINTAQASLVVLSGQTVTFNTTDGTFSGDHSGSGFTVSGGVALFDFSVIDFQSGSAINFTGSNAVHLQSATDFTINTTLTLSGADGVGATLGAGALGGSSGGAEANHGEGPGAGQRGDTGVIGGGGGAGYGGVGGNGGRRTNAGPVYSDSLLSNGLLGGSGGGGGAASAIGGGGGGAGGGAIRLEAGSLLSLDANAEIFTDGGAGGDQHRAAGGGSGGAIHLIGSSIVVNTDARLNADGGGGGTGVGAGSDGGGGGGGGRILFDAGSLSIDGLSQNFGALTSSDQVSVLGGLASTAVNPGDHGAAGTIHFIPEPGTYAALFGLSALGFAFFRRRRARQ